MLKHFGKIRRGNMKKIIVLLSIVMSFPAFAAEPEIKGSPDDVGRFLQQLENIVTISGAATEKAYSDRAIISLIVTTEDKLLSRAIQLNTELREMVSKKLMENGLTKENIKSSKFSLSPEYGWFGSKPNSYKVINRMSITISDEGHLKSIADISDANKEIDFGDTVFEHSKKDELESKVRMKAISDVYNKKTFYEEKLNVQLVPVGFNEDYVGQGGTQGAFLLNETVVNASKVADSYSVSRNAKFEDSSFDEILYEAGISVQFKLLKKNGAEHN
jgi:uncharacterized protein YggE